MAKRTEPADDWKQYLSRVRLTDVVFSIFAFALFHGDILEFASTRTEDFVYLFVAYVGATKLDAWIRKRS